MPTLYSSFTSSVSSTTYAALVAPTALAAAVVGPDSLSLSWAATGVAISGFSLERSLDGLTGWTVVASPSASPVVDSGLTAGTVYHYKVRSQRTGSVEYSPYSEIIEASTAAPLPSPVRLRMFIHSPEVVMQCRVNMPSGITFPLDRIEYDTITIGAWADIEQNMTLLLGSADGLDDYGVQRVRKLPTASTLYVGRSSRGSKNGELNVIDNAHITILADYRVWSKTEYIAPNGTIFKDSDIAYVDQNLESDPVSNCGPGMAGTTDPLTNLLTVHFDGTASFATADGASIVSFAWDLDDGNFTVGSASTSTITATFVSGFRFVSLTVVDSNGKSHLSRCPVYARFPGDEWDALDFEITNHRITPAGQQMSVKVLSDIPVSTYPDEVLVILFDGEPASPSDRSHILGFFWMHTDPANIAAQRTGTLKDTTLNLLDVAGKMDILPGFNHYLDWADVPENWAQMHTFNKDKLLHYLIHHHSTALELADFTWTGTGSAYETLARACPAAPLWSQVAHEAQTLVPNFVLTCNTLGQIRVLPDPFLLDVVDRVATIQATLDAASFSALRWTHQRPARAHWLHANAVKVSITEIESFFCVAPGEASAQGEIAQEQGEQLAISQADLNAQEGHRYARINAPESHFSITLAEGDDLGIEPADMTWVALTLPATVAAQRGLTFTSARGLVHEVSIRYEHTRTGLVRSVELTWELETSGTPATTVTVTPATPIPTGWTPNPTPTELTVPPPVIIAGVENIAMINDLGTIFKTANFQSSPPTWTAYDGLKNTVFGTANELLSFVVDPFSPLYRGTGTTVRGFVATEDGIWRVDDMFGVLGSPTATNLYNFVTTSSVVQDRSINASFGRYQPAEADNPWLMVASYYKNPLGTPKGVAVVYSTNAGRTWSAEVTVSALTPTGSKYNNWRPRIGLWLSPRTPGLAITAGYANTSNPALAINKGSLDWGATWANYNPYLELEAVLGGCIHFPWTDNLAERIAFYGSVDLLGSAAIHSTYHSDTSGYAAIDITPTEAGIPYGPHRFPFAIRTYDNDRQIVAMAGRANSVDLVEISPNSKAAVFVSSDGGATWTLIDGPYSADANDVYPTQVAFAADDPDVLLIWGNERHISQASVSTLTVENKEGNIHALSSSGEEIIGLVGGDS